MISATIAATGRVAALVLLCSAFGVTAETRGTFSTEAGAAFLDGSPVAAAEAAASLELAEGRTASRFLCNLQGRAGALLSGSAAARADFSWNPGELSTVCSLEGGLSGTEGGLPSWRSALGLLVAIDGTELSTKGSLGLERQSVDGLLSTIADAGLEFSYLAGDFLLKPKVDGSFALADAGGTTLSILPGLGLSWYPGLPVSASLAGGWSRSYAGSTPSDSLVAEAGLYAALGPAYGRIEGSATIGAGGLSAGAAEAGITFDIGRIGKSRLSLPTRASWLLGGSPVFSLFAGLGLSMD
ncbi:MAG TPA: hypothetical protein VMV44_16435 [Rectinemataceae bacterium]|nr:hypothetical protein [Rectinemataceae bacterium]